LSETLYLPMIQAIFIRDEESRPLRQKQAKTRLRARFSWVL
jgi:hypothetical protein